MSWRAAAARRPSQVAWQRCFPDERRRTCVSAAGGSQQHAAGLVHGSRCVPTDRFSNRQARLSLSRSFVSYWALAQREVCGLGPGWAPRGQWGTGCTAFRLAALGPQLYDTPVWDTGFPSGLSFLGVQNWLRSNSPRACDSLPCALCDCERVCGSEQAACCPCSRAARACGLASNCAPSVRLGLCIHASARDANSPAPLARVPGMCKAGR